MKGCAGPEPHAVDGPAQEASRFHRLCGHEVHLVDLVAGGEGLQQPGPARADEPPQPAVR